MTAEIIDLSSRIRVRRQGSCAHEHVEVAETEASMSCVDCGAEIDPWWFLRAEGRRAEERQREQAVREAMLEEWRLAAVATIERLNAEIATLTEAKNRLWNTQVDGRPLGSLVTKTGRIRGRG